MEYYDAKKLIFSEYNFHGRAVVNKMSSIFVFNSNSNNIINTYIQYVILHTHT